MRVGVREREREREEMKDERNKESELLYCSNIMNNRNIESKCIIHIILNYTFL